MPTPRGPDADKRSEERRQAEKMFLDSNGNAKLVDIAEKLKLPPNKIRKWKSMDKWEEKLHPSGAEKAKKNKWSVPLAIKGAFHLKRRERAHPRETKMRRGIITLCRLRIPPSMEGILRCTGIP